MGIPPIVVTVMKTKPISMRIMRKGPPREHGALAHSNKATLVEASTPIQAKAGEKLARRDQLVLEHLPLVKAIAASIRTGLPQHTDFDDLVQAGAMGLFDAARKFDFTKNTAFSAYAKHRIRGAILDSLRALDVASRGMRRHQKRADAATFELTATLQRVPSECEVAEKLNIGIDQWRKIRLNMTSIQACLSPTAPKDDEDTRALDFPCKPEVQPDSILVRKELRSLLAEAARTLSQRYQQVVHLYFNEEMTMKEIGKVLGINESRVSQIQARALGKMADVLQASGITSSLAFQ
jgi:RNA polymerase sigma factor for flagellar operon FliA